MLLLLHIALQRQCVTLAVTQLSSRQKKRKTSTEHRKGMLCPVHRKRKSTKQKKKKHEREIEKHEREKGKGKLRRQIPAAAGLIQCLWRCYAADKSFYSKVTILMILRWQKFFRGNMEDPPEGPTQLHVFDQLEGVRHKISFTYIIPYTYLLYPQYPSFGGKFPKKIKKN